MKIGLCTIANKSASIDDVIELAAETGYDGIEVWGKDHIGDGSRAHCQRIVEQTNRHDLEIPVYGSYLRPGSDDFDQRAIEDELAIANNLEADLIRVWAGTQEYQEHTASHWETVVEDLQSVVDQAAEVGLSVTLEKHAGTLTNNGEGAKRLVNEIEGPCGINYQPHFSLSPDALRSELEELVEFVNNVHMQAVPSKGGSERCLLEDAYFDIPGLLDILQEHSFSGFIEVEFVSADHSFETAIQHDLTYLRTYS